MMRSLLLVFLSLFVVAGLLGCDCSEGDTTSAFGPDCGEVEGEIPGDDDDDPNGGDGIARGVLIVSDQGEGSFRRFTEVDSLEGEVATDRPVQGELTRMSRPQFLTMLGDELIVCDEATNSILFFENPGSLVGNVPPTRILQGPATRMNAPVQAAVDPETDELWVLNRAGSTLLVFANASEIEGEVAPTRRIEGAATEIRNPSCFQLLPGQDRLLVFNPNQVLTFENMRRLEGAPVPFGRVGGEATQFNNIVYARLSPTGTLITTNAATNAIVFHEQFDPERNAQAPDRVLQGSNTRIQTPGQFVLAADGMYLANGTEVLYFSNLASIEGNPFPTRRFSATNPASAGLRGAVLLGGAER